MVKTLSPNSQVCQAQPHSLLNSVSASLTIGVCQVFQAGGCRATEPTKWREDTWAMLCSSSAAPYLSHMAPAKGAARLSQHPRTANSFLSVSQLAFLTSWFGWLVNPRDPQVTASPALGLQLHITMPGFCFLTWILGVKYKSPCLQGKHLIH